MKKSTLDTIDRYSAIISFLISLTFILIVLPHPLYIGYALPLTITFILVFSFSMTCVAKNLIQNYRTARVRNHSIVSIQASMIGISAFHVCGTLACGYGAGLFLLSTIFPAVFLDFLAEYNVWIIMVSIGLQLGVLYKMKCRPHFRKLLHIIN